MNLTYVIGIVASIVVIILGMAIKIDILASPIVFDFKIENVLNFFDAEIGRASCRERV